MRRNGQTYRVISRDLRRPVSTNHRSIQRFRETGNEQDKAEKDALRVGMIVSFGFVYVVCLTAVQARHELDAVRGVTVSERTVRGRFEEAGLGSFVLDVNHRRNRLTIAQEHRLWNADQ
ncbi:uncharacterized protein LOC120635574 [Pararge aegeria]|uniref:uncharacterized protein LOC120635574 n=1 Tax=Pararge aegeria TaxID=116150 RepID=UPI0019CFA41F|nr:uncharacterized protein LOC120635574 [Pararge aegeria]